MGEYDTFPNFWAFLHRVFSSAKWGNMILFFIFGLFSLYFLEICFKILKISQGLPLWQLSCLCWARLGWRFQIQYSDELDSQKSEWGWIKFFKTWNQGWILDVLVNSNCHFHLTKLSVLQMKQFVRTWLGVK